jgi:hypothetical protein
MSPRFPPNGFVVDGGETIGSLLAAVDDTDHLAVNAGTLTTRD